MANKLYLVLAVLVLSFYGCDVVGLPSEIESPFGTLLSISASEVPEVVSTLASEIGDEVESPFGTLVAQSKTQIAEQIATQRANIATQIAEKQPSPWDTSWLPTDRSHVVGKIDQILSGSGLEGQGEAMLTYSLQHGVNPAFALAMFRKEASFAMPGTRAYTNKNPGNIIATGDCRGELAGTACTGVYGEISTDGRFGIYASMQDGIHAYYLLLEREYMPGTSRDCTTISCVISAYCPATECDTDRYVAQIATWTAQYMLTIVAP